MINKIIDEDIINKEVNISGLIVPVIPFIWYREQEAVCHIKKKEKGDKYDYVLYQEHFFKDTNLYICLHSLMYYKMHRTTDNLLIIPNTFDHAKNFQVKIEPVENSKIIEVNGGLKINEFVSGQVYIHGGAFSPPGTLHFKVDEARDKNEFVLHIKNDELGIDLKCLYILINSL